MSRVRGHFELRRSVSSDKTECSERGLTSLPSRNAYGLLTALEA